MSSTPGSRAGAAIIGSGNIGTDLLVKLGRSDVLDVVAMVGIDARSDGLRKARELGVATVSDGVEGLLEMDGFERIDVIFDATSAGAHRHNDAVLRPFDKQLVDLTPAALGPFVVPVVNLDEQGGARNLNMVTCGGQATIPVVHAVSRVTAVHYAEVVASIASRSAGPGTRASIDEFTQTTALGLERVGNARAAKAIIVLNPAEPPMLMRDTVFCLVSGEADTDAIARSLDEVVAEVQQYVPGYRLKQRVQFDRVDASALAAAPIDGGGDCCKVSVYLEIEGAADYLPAYAGNLDIMTSAAVRTGEQVARVDAVVG